MVFQATSYRSRCVIKKLRKAVFPVAGLGTRFLPATKATAKEMLPVVDKPLIQYAVEEARAAGIDKFCMVTGRGKTALVEHFDVAFELEATLRERGKSEALEQLRSTQTEPGSMVTVRQQVPLGLGHAIWCARAFIGDDPFAILLPDDLVLADKPCLSQLAEVYRDTGANVLPSPRYRASKPTAMAFSAPVRMTEAGWKCSGWSRSRRRRTRHQIYPSSGDIY